MNDVIKKKDMVDIDKTYYTLSGKRVILHETVLYNSCNQEVTFPIKGSVVLSEHPYRIKYQIWTLDGRACVLNSKHPDNLKK